VGAVDVSYPGFFGQMVGSEGERGVRILGAPSFYPENIIQAGTGWEQYFSHHSSSEIFSNLLHASQMRSLD
jgi:hypothetical protein